MRKSTYNMQNNRQNIIFLMFISFIVGFNAHAQKSVNDFIRISNDHNERRPVVVFLPGSNPNPLLVKESKGNYFCLSTGNFDVNKIAEKYHVIIPAQPHTPVMVEDTSHLNDQYAYITDPENPYSFNIDFLKDNHLENHAWRVRNLINYLKTKEYVDKGRLILLGHSQGGESLWKSQKILSDCMLWDCYHPVLKVVSQHLSPKS